MIQKIWFKYRNKNEGTLIAFFQFDTTAIIQFMPSYRLLFCIFSKMLIDKILTKSKELDFVKIEFYEPDVVIYHYRSGTHLNLDMIQNVARETNEMISYKACFMCSIIGDGLTLEKEVRDWGTKPEGLAYTKAAAIVQNSLAHRILANFIVRVQRPPIPMKAFNNVKDALTWFDRLR